MNSYYNQNYTEEDINKILEIIKECIQNNNYTIAMNENRQENIEFINEYNIRSDRQKSILLQLHTNDFCHTLQNTKVGYEYEVLYVFVPQVNLYDANGIEVRVDIYIKINIIDTPSGKRVAVISFHKRNKPTDYLFK
ncbi:hypothetical protein EGX98_12085 [Fusobacterium necrophorum]|uniref:Uncharacterized protein n=2 Tax=Fusobacterium necrophorum TaxID=859 RepID=A0AB73BWJ6_9FUSO|nr:hypothetical protein [Fusobacterium necrophorum]AYZ74684.1 hypothetical protein EGX98_12085 [Fusobacterium necrophorum]AZW09430.1 hypothetical protein EO219_07500 [Fusobacterium necrophorum subsp. necrophorum]KDE63436.1 hypothetical protein FUSO3_05245 [Fusobacterium necrophorum BL]KDE66061.1 hypothetical protein FUSO4_05430 [Fusobacterium necrophorum DJ-1]KDE71860.1 hypothetical protein FUSO7_09375 [Fusobacterium necrophorum BFTR-2]